MTQLLIHLWGDYLLQSDWMATNKTKRWFPCACHVLLYSVGFLLLHPSWRAMAVIAGTHFLIDRYRLARFVVWTKNVLLDPQIVYVKEVRSLHGTLRPSRYFSFHECAATGYPPNRPEWLTVWLLIIADNTLHLTINALALRYL